MPIGMNDNVLRIDGASIVVVLNHHVEQVPIPLELGLLRDNEASI